MRCFFCKGDLLESATTHVADLGKSVIIIRNVPCLKCSQCGETSYIGTVVKRLEEIVKLMQTSLMEIAVVSYSDIAA
jgi:YgiT-type zinc finger domain-containing protein